MDSDKYENFMIWLLIWDVETSVDVIWRYYEYDYIVNDDEQEIWWFLKGWNWMRDDVITIYVTNIQHWCD